MELIHLYNIRLNSVQIFVTAAESCSFTKAAEYLHLTQPMISKTIKTLENDLGIVLFIRQKGTLQLTPAGKSLYSQWRGIIRSFEESLEVAHVLQEGKKEKITIGLGNLALQDALFHSLKCFSEKNENIDMQIEQFSMFRLIKALKKDQCDAILISRHMKNHIQFEDFSWKVIRQTNLAIYISRENPLSKKKNITFKDLKNQNFISFSRHIDKEYHDLLENLAADAGFVPRISTYVQSESSFRLNLELNKGIVMADSMSDLESDTVRKVVLPNLSNDIILVWKDSHYHGALKTFVDTIG